MSEVLVFQHDPLDDLGFFGEVLEKQGTEYRIVRLFHGEMPAEEWEDVSALIVLGGPMSMGEEARFPFLHWEKRIIRAAIDEAVPILGVCFGAHLIAAALGTQIFHGSFKEIGWTPISITPHGQVDSLLGYLPENARYFSGTAMALICRSERFVWPPPPITARRPFDSARPFTGCSFTSR